ncbi:MAG: Maf family protein [Halioglobus sp.]|nr:Maf family protein [Halioglobus sp.]
MPETRLVLASSSPRRKELLNQLGVEYLCDPAEIDESQWAGESPQDYVQRMALEKAGAVAVRYRIKEVAILAADTTVVIDNHVLGKPRDHVDALSILARLSGRTHRVLTAVCLLDATDIRSDLVATDVEFATLDREICEAYLATEEPWDKAGAYAIQGLGGAFVCTINGSYSNVVGLPLYQTWQLLNSIGLATGLHPASVKMIP